ncbi:two-component system chemotaxis sensor kinase CheA [Archangium gephyra]|uniref:Chemotaxis protein CheA n=1 Tax=Archangium gephyra TaxID=48 RepID=A0AAC8QI77_9BACT|nr:chemotaxis protein CheA [Archangium gephyra]AKJ08006.1 Signal transduction histidine kinase CheA [Archangium gephyra]REG29750.1 two-component system chemotaxis sensor kinase CheA [Archangium gephyra]
MNPELEKVHAVFLTETEEQLVSLEQELLALEASPGPETLRAVFRTVHTLKGGTAVMGYSAAVELAHTLEELLTRLEAGVLVLHSGLGTLLLQSVDALRELVGLRPVAEPDLRLPASDVHSLLASTVAASRPVGTGPASVGAEWHGPETSAEPAEPSPSRERTLRVGLDRLDRMLDLTGEIAIARGRLTTMLAQAHRYTPEQLLEAHRGADALYLDLQELVMKVRMVPIGRTFQPFTRTVRDLCLATGKRVRLEVSGQDVEVDTTVTELIRDPLTHLVRNAMDHGMETPEVREERGKEPTGTLALRAFHEAGSIIIQVAEDGAGLDRARILARARERGLVGPEETPEDDALFRLIFEPGFSTAERVTELSGRGVGMDVVKRNVEQLRGTISVDTTPGKGTTFSLRLPLTLSIIEGFSVGMGEETYVIPLEHVVECVELPPGECRPGRTGVFNLRGEPLPYLRLREHFSLGGAPPPRESIVVIGHGRGRAGIAVDMLLGQGQTVIKPLGKPCQGLPGLAGSTLMGDGRVALILDVPALLQQALKAVPPPAAVA